MTPMKALYEKFCNADGERLSQSEAELLMKSINDALNFLQMHPDLDRIYKQAIVDVRWLEGYVNGLKAAKQKNKFLNASERKIRKHYEF